MPPSAAAFARSLAMRSPCRSVTHGYLSGPGRAQSPAPTIRCRRSISPSAPRHPIGSRQRHAGHRRCLDGEGGEVLGLEVEDVALAAGARQGLRLERQNGEVVAQLARALRDDEPLLERRVLRRDADRAAPGMAVVAIARGGAEGAVVVAV